MIHPLTAKVKFTLPGTTRPHVTDINTLLTLVGRDRRAELMGKLMDALGCPAKVRVCNGESVTYWVEPVVN